MERLGFFRHSAWNLISFDGVCFSFSICCLEMCFGLSCRTGSGKESWGLRDPRASKPLRKKIIIKQYQINSSGKHSLPSTFLVPNIPDPLSELWNGTAPVCGHPIAKSKREAPGHTGAQVDFMQGKSPSCLRQRFTSAGGTLRT